MTELLILSNENRKIFGKMKNFFNYNLEVQMRNYKNTGQDYIGMSDLTLEAKKQFVKKLQGSVKTLKSISKDELWQSNCKTFGWIE